MKRKYELVYVVSPVATDAQVTDCIRRSSKITQRLGGTIEKTDNWGRRKLAYEIGPHKEGTYVLETIDGGGELMKEIDRRLKSRSSHPSPRRPHRRGTIGRRRVRTRRTENSRRRRVARACLPIGRPVKDSAGR